MPLLIMQWYLLFYRIIILMKPYFLEVKYILKYTLEYRIYSITICYIINNDDFI